MKCTTVLHEGVCNRALTPHKSGNKMKDKKSYCWTNTTRCIERQYMQWFRDSYNVCIVEIIKCCLNVGGFGEHLLAVKSENYC